MKIISIVGARPQFIKAAPVSRELRKEFKEILVHTGQHYDKNMSEIFFEQLNIPVPDYNLGIGSGNHGAQTGQMLIELEKVVLEEKPQWILVYGDTNSTLAGALVASKLHIPLIHIEAGLRSYNKSMPEEINRILTDNVSSILSCPTRTAVENLKKEGFKNILNEGQLISLHEENIKIDVNKAMVVNTGDVMYDAILYNLKLARKKSNNIVSKKGLEKKGYYLATVHRAENTDNPAYLKNIFKAFKSLDRKIIIPLHPRTKKCLKKYDLVDLIEDDIIDIIEPVGYLDMLTLISHSDKVITDSGGLQKEAFMLEKPCITLRNETEWVETVDCGWNKLAGLGGNKVKDLINYRPDTGNRPLFYGKGDAAKRIVNIIKNANR